MIILFLDGPTPDLSCLPGEQGVPLLLIRGKGGELLANVKTDDEQIVRRMRYCSQELESDDYTMGYTTISSCSKYFAFKVI